MPSSSIVASIRPHIGSEVGGETRFGEIPESQCPSLPAQHGMSDDALATGKSGATNESATKRHKKHNAARESCLGFMNFFAIIVINLKRSGTWQVWSGPNVPSALAVLGANRIHRRSTQKQSPAGFDLFLLTSHLREQEEWLIVPITVRIKPRPLRP